MAGLDVLEKIKSLAPSGTEEVVSSRTEYRRNGWYMPVHIHQTAWCSHPTRL